MPTEQPIPTEDFMAFMDFVSEDLQRCVREAEADGDRREARYWARYVVCWGEAHAYVLKLLIAASEHKRLPRWPAPPLGVDRRASDRAAKSAARAISKGLKRH